MEDEQLFGLLKVLYTRLEANAKKKVRKIWLAEIVTLTILIIVMLIEITTVFSYLRTPAGFSNTVNQQLKVGLVVCLALMLVYLFISSKRRKLEDKAFKRELEQLDDEFKQMTKKQNDC